MSNLTDISDVIIIGSGPAGLSAAIYVVRAGLSVTVIEKEFMGTGQLGILLEHRQPQLLLT